MLHDLGIALVHRQQLKQWSVVFSLLCLFTSCQTTVPEQQTDVVQTLKQQLNEKSDSLAVLRSLLQEKATAAPLAAPNMSALVSPGAPIKLYGKPEIEELDTYEFAEVISLFDTTSTFMAEYYEVRALLVCNGPPDNDLEECNCSHYMYIATGTYDIPQDYKIFRVGPFFMPRFKGWSKNRSNPAIMLEHDIKGKKKTETFQIAFDRVAQL